MKLSWEAGMEDKYWPSYSLEGWEVVQGALKNHREGSVNLQCSRRKQTNRVSSVHSDETS